MPRIQNALILNFDNEEVNHVQNTKFAPGGRFIVPLHGVVTREFNSQLIVGTFDNIRIVDRIVYADINLSAELFSELSYGYTFGFSGSTRARDGLNRISEFSIDSISVKHN